MSRLFLFGELVCSCLMAEYSSADRSPAPAHREAGSIAVSSRLRRSKSFSYHNLHGYRRGGTFDSPKVPKRDLGLRPKNPTHRNARPDNQRAVSRSVG